MQPTGPVTLVHPFALRLLADDFPSLSPERRAAVVEFVARRVAGLPSFTRFGVLTLAACFATLLRLPGGWNVTRTIVKLPLPFVPEYPRLIRSLSVAYIWERWPDTLPSGASPSTEHES